MVVDWVMRVVCLESNVWIGMLMSRMTMAPLAMWQKGSDLALPHYDTRDVSAITDLPYMVVSHDLG